MQDFTGVPAVVDLAAMRAAMAKAGGDPQKINPLSPVDLVIDHSVMVDKFASESAFGTERRDRDAAQRRTLRLPALGPERLRQLQRGTAGHRHLPPGQPGVPGPHGLDQGRGMAGPTPSRTPWSAPTPHHHDQRPRRARLGRRRHRGGSRHARPAGIDADPRGHRLQAHRQAARGHHRHRPGADRHADAAQEGRGGEIRRVLRRRPGRPALADRATIANMAPEYGATCGFFPVDEITLGYLRLSGRPESTVKLVEAYSKEQGLWREKGHEPVFTDTLHLDMGRSRGQPGRTEAPAGPRGPAERRQRLQRVPRPAVASLQHRRRPPAQRGRRRHRGRRQRRLRRDRLPARRPDPPPEERRGGDRRHHLLHQHLQPQRDDGRRPAGEEGGGKRPATASPG